MRAMRAGARAATIPASAANRPALQASRPLAVLLLAMAALVVAVPPGGEFPIDIDWNYARVVQSLIERGRLEISPWTAASLVLQAYWGSLFAVLFGFSHTTLRISTLVLAAAGVLGFYRLLCELFDWRRALLGALLLLFNPLYVCLSYSFKSNVPFLALAIWALFCYVRGVRAARPRLVWLVAGSAFAGGAFLVRQIGVALPLAVAGAWLLAGNWRGSRRELWREAWLRRSLLTAMLGPFCLAVLVGLYLDQLRGPVKQEPAGWMLDFWADQGLGMVGVVLARLAGAFSTLGIFTLPLSAGWLITRPTLGLSRPQHWLIGVLLLALFIGLVLLSLVFGESPYFPHIGDTLSPRGFYIGNSNYFDGTVPASIAVPEWGLLVATDAAILGCALLVLAIARLIAPEIARSPAAIPLLFGLIALALTVPYHSFYDDYVLALLPSALLAALLAFRAARWVPALALVGVVLLAGWSIWWERDLLERDAAIWQAGRALVERGIPPDQIDGGFEWNGWYRGQAVIAAAVQQGQSLRLGSHLQGYIIDGLHMKRARWVLAFAVPPGAAAERVLVTVPYGNGQQVFGLQRY
jgi:4-amino-4-deoxy-L-arabinose transferase-like glycosyltransferase